MDGRTLVEYFNTPARYPHNLVRSDLGPGPFNSSDLHDVCLAVERHVDQLRLEEFCLRTEQWAGLVVVHAMDKAAPRGRLRNALEADGFVVSERRNQYGISLEVHPHRQDLIMTRYAEIVGVICEMLPEATDIRTLHAQVERRLGHALPIGLCSSQVQIFNMSLMTLREGRPLDKGVPEGMARLVTVALESGAIPPLCQRWEARPSARRESAQ
jgi:hypothetical protein